MRSLIVFSHLRWSFVHQRPQHVLSRLAQHYKVLFIEEPVHADGPPSIGRTHPAPNVEVLTPRTPSHAPGYHDDQMQLIKPLLSAWLAEHQVDDYAVWFYTPMALPLLDGLAPRAVVYDCMDELAAFMGAPQEMRDREAALLQVADVVFTGGPSLFESKRHRHANVLCLPSAVDANHFSPDRALDDHDAVNRADTLQGHVPHPRLGFFGVIDERLDIGLLEALADADPNWHIVMAGPVVKIDPARLPQRPNIHWLGQQPYDLLPQLVAGWDVCLLPFAMNESTRFISPTKTLEYMAAKKPVVSTAVPDVSLLYGEVVGVAQDHAHFIDHCKRTLAETLFKRAARATLMQSTVSQYSWDATAFAMRQAIDDIVNKAVDQERQRSEAIKPRPKNPESRLAPCLLAETASLVAQSPPPVANRSVGL